MTFDEWFSQHEWWKKNSRREDLEPVWDTMHQRGIQGLEIASLIEKVIDAMRDEYGD